MRYVGTPREVSSNGYFALFLPKAYNMWFMMMLIIMMIMMTIVLTITTMALFTIYENDDSGLRDHRDGG